VLALGALLACRCGGSLWGDVNDAGFVIGTPPSATASSTGMRALETEHASGRCPAPEARRLQGSASAGQACNAGTECAPVCCTCEGSATSWLAALCVDQKCGDRVQACSQPPAADFCSRGP
jgi:hypothetical protein